MDIVSRFNMFIDEVNEERGLSIPHGITILDSLNNYLAETEQLTKRFDSVDKALYALANTSGGGGGIQIGWK